MPQERNLSTSERETRKALPAYSLHLDFLRGMASLVVFAGHLHVVCSGHTETAAEGQAHGFVVHPANATGLAHAAVVIFFVLSGYLVGGSVLRDLKRNTFSLYSYGLRRLTRLWTVLVPALVLCAAFDAVSLEWFSTTRVVALGEFSKGLHGSPRFVQYMWYLGFLQSIDRLSIPFFGTDWALWSLSNEFWFYILFPIFAVSLLGSRYPKLLRAGLAGLAICLLVFLGKGIASSFPVWLCGVVAYLAPARLPDRFQRTATSVMCVQFCFAVVLMRSVAVGGVTGDMIVAVSFTFLLYSLLHQVKPASTTLYSRIAHIMSFPSYSLYAIHIPLCVLLAAVCEATFPKMFLHTELTCAVIAPVVLVYAGCFYLLFERNTDRIRVYVESHRCKYSQSDDLEVPPGSTITSRLQSINVSADGKSGARG